MVSSCFYTIGKTHNVCQDYAMAGVIQPNNRMYAALSDGCSSVEYADIGARMVVLNAIEQLRNGYNHGIIAYYSLCQAKANMKSNFSILDCNCLTATLLLAEELPNGNIQASIFGDGFVLARKINGTIEIIQVDFQNYPFYPLYLFSEEYAKAYFQHGPRTKKVSKTMLDSSSMKLVNIETENIEYTYERYIDEFNYKRKNTLSMWSDSFNRNEYDLIVLASDGIDSFFSADGTHILPEQVIAQIMSIKTFGGEFMLRRGRAVTRNVCKANGWVYHDDVSLAAIYLGGNKTNAGLCEGKQ